MFRASPHETLDRDMRCLHHPQLPVAGQESDPSAQQEGHDAGDLSRRRVANPGDGPINSITFNTKPNPY